MALGHPICSAPAGLCCPCATSRGPDICSHPALEETHRGGDFGLVGLSNMVEDIYLHVSRLHYRYPFGHLQGRKVTRVDHAVCPAWLPVGPACPATGCLLHAVANDYGMTSRSGQNILGGSPAPQRDCCCSCARFSWMPAKSCSSSGTSLLPASRNGAHCGQECRNTSSSPCVRTDQQPPCEHPAKWAQAAER